jgi:NAD(P)-dependent dehydrogenase (short-subunit alcohol dehydrogenase family)
VPHLRRAATDNGDASIVFILSMSMRKVRLNEGAYSSSKAALRTAVQSLALELGPARIRVNAVAPGWIGGPSVDIFIDWDSEQRGIAKADVRAEIEAPLASSRRRTTSRLGGVLRVAVVERHHRSDPRRERWRVVRVARPA